MFEISVGSVKSDLVPFNIQCKDFKWIDKNDIMDAKGASGIGRIRNEDGQRQFFVPSYLPDSLCLDCEMTILDDILKDHEVYFAFGDSLSKKMNLTDFHENTPKKKVDLFCLTRENGLPPGCKKNPELEYPSFATPK